jgi:hypothetical protein
MREIISATNPLSSTEQEESDKVCSESSNNGKHRFSTLMDNDIEKEEGTAEYFKCVYAENLKTTGERKLPFQKTSTFGRFSVSLQ